MMKGRWDVGRMDIRFLLTNTLAWFSSYYVHAEDCAAMKATEATHRLQLRVSAQGKKKKNVYGQTANA